MVTAVIGWILLGLVAGYIASRLVNQRGEGLSYDILLGIVGAVIGGWLFTAAGATGVTGFNVWSLMVAVGGAMVSLVVWHAIRRSTANASDAPYRKT
jgi:uncharacterized membrane protein YeaQ/YmgE (transglycosylase-associated protein family)